MKTLNERIQDLRNILVTCYKAIKEKGGSIPEEGERNMTNLPAAVASIPQTHGVLTELEVTANGTYTPQEGVDGFSKVTANFDTSSLPKVKVSSLAVTNECINEYGRWTGDTLIDTSVAQTLSFQSNEIIKKIDAVGWDTSTLTKLSFRWCGSLEEILGVENFNVSKMTDMLGMFQNTKISHINLSKWDVSNVTSFAFMMYGMNNLVWVDISNWILHPNANINGFLLYTFNVETLVGDRTIDEVIANNIGVFVGLSQSYSLFEDSKKINTASILALVNGLADLTGQTEQTLTLGSTIGARLDKEKIAGMPAKDYLASKAGEKYWTIAY